MIEPEHIRNFCIIAHIDHGKSTLADRFIEKAHLIDLRKFQDQMLDNMDIERERGITIKSQAVSLPYAAKDGQTYMLNLVDTPGHVDFSYEVSRAISACEGAILVIDATQGVEAQTLSNMYMALEHDLEIIPVINKIDMPAADVEGVRRQIDKDLGLDGDSALAVSAKLGTGVDELFEAIVERIPAPSGRSGNPLQALIFDSHYDSFKGVVAYVRMVDGEVRQEDELHMIATGVDFKPVEVGIFSPNLKATGRLSSGDVGYIATGLKTVSEGRVGDTVTQKARQYPNPLPGYKEPKPVVFAGIYPVEGEDYNDLKEALEKLQLNDAALVYEPETSQALNFGFRCGFLGMFHMEIVQERLEREYDLDIIVTAPSGEYEVELRNGETIRVGSPAFLPDEENILEIREPWMNIQIFTPTEFYGAVMDLTTKRRGVYLSEEYPAPTRVQLNFEIPLSDLIVDFFDELKSRTRGYASLDYQVKDYRAGNLVRLEVHVNMEPVDAFTTIVHKEQAYNKGQRLITKLKELIPRQLFVVPIQAVSSGKVISRANIKALRKDVLAKCYGGDVTRKRKLLEKQKKGKKRMKMIGSVEIPQEAFLAILRLEDE